MALIEAILLDRDGTVIADKHYLADPAGVELIPGAAEALANLSAKGARLFIVTNQSGIGRGYFTEDAYYACHAALERSLKAHGITMSGSVHCPHAPEEQCSCRKPLLGMWQNLATAYGLTPDHTAMVGDKAEDVCFGRKANFPAVALVLTGKGKSAAARLGVPTPNSGEEYVTVPEALLPGGEHLPHIVAADLLGAASWLMTL